MGRRRAERHVRLRSKKWTGSPAPYDLWLLFVDGEPSPVRLARTPRDISVADAEAANLDARNAIEFEVTPEQFRSLDEGRHRYTQRFTESRIVSNPQRSIALTEPQASVVEIYVIDPAHDDEREPWWPKLSGRRLAWDDDHTGDVHGLFIDIANAEEDDKRVSASATAIATKIIKIMKANPISGMPGDSVSGCIELQRSKPKGKRPTDPGAYCASIADRLEPGWRRTSKPRERRMASRLAKGTR